MLRYTKLEHRFAQYIPEQLEPGVLYISIEYATAAHSCCCGCGLQVITPFTPTDWKLTFDGETISLWPSIGNWNFPCRSHYIIERSQILTAEPWEDKQHESSWRREKKRRNRHNDEKVKRDDRPTDITHSIYITENLGLWGRIKQKVLKKQG